MIDADRDDYRRQFEIAQRHLPRGHVVNHAVWRNGQLTVASANPVRMSKEPEFVPRVRRGIQAGLFD